MSSGVMLKPVIRRAGTGRELKVMGTHVLLRLIHEDTGGRNTAAQITAQPGQGVPEHTHEDEDETFRILAGTIEFTAGGNRFIAQEGDIVFGPRGVPHSWFVVGEETATMEVLFTPSGMEELFQELHDLGVRGEDSLPNVIAVCARYRIHFH